MNNNIYIAICDDNEEICLFIENALLHYAKRKHINITIDVFYTGEKLITYIRNETIYNLIFLDVNLNTILGTKIGEILRNELKCEETHLVYISSNTNYAISLFKSRPMDFLVKPISMQEIENTFQTFIDLNLIEQHFFEYKVGQTYHGIRYNEIYYIETYDRKLRIITKNKIYEFYGKLDEVYEDISSKNKFFLHIHKSYVINYNYAIKTSYEQIQMNNNIVLPISKSNRSSIRKQIIDLVKEKK